MLKVMAQLATSEGPIMSTLVCKTKLIKYTYGTDDGLKDKISKSTELDLLHSIFLNKGRAGIDKIKKYMTSSFLKD